LEYNLNHYKQELGAGTKIMAMVKAFSYGSGSFEIANLLEFNKVDYLAVAYADEGVALRNAGCSLPIMVMSPDAMAFENNYPA
jgi:alanine racemase